MKRSELNKIMDDAIQFIHQCNFVLPPFVTWTQNDWNSKGHEYDEIRDNMLGWDITDFGSGNFLQVGLLMITLRNGNFYQKEKYPKPYAEKLLISKKGQVTPYHFHWSKMEDIINRGGGDLLVKCYNSTEDKALADTPVELYSDGRRLTVNAGEVLRFKPGESISIPPEVYHTFWGEGADVLIGEISKVNDDHVDNYFLKGNARFPEIEEDEPKKYLLYTEYPDAQL
ncbi:D-lyxose/D-mannose family sugar isomerase [Lachnospiraceae bacterium ASD3451]|uniref:D-lyxose/D-mannose family sugar isomerase n=1 Tax=Diplocloster agilis TaxID=2850323 RepID=UPI001D9C0FA9|nr:D-lyxose/D-mannose family sugar isomerase [Diplocloster agilis]MBU9745560.1 D-lyxose/D-mannose family sugar isomerase [Diplocloster agilis]